MVLFLNMTGLTMMHVPYKSSPSGVIDVMAGHVPLMMANMVVAVPNVRTGRLRAYGVTSARAPRGAPDLPTIAEMGSPGYEAVQWYSLVAPAATPRDIIMKVHAAMLRGLQDPGVQQAPQRRRRRTDAERDARGIRRHAALQNREVGEGGQGGGDTAGIRYRGK